MRVCCPRSNRCKPPCARNTWLHATASRATTEGERVTLPLLQNVLVLAVGRDLGAQEVSAQRRDVDRRFNEVTLSVTVEQAQIVTYAAQAGTLTLTLRNPDDIQILEGLPETTRNDIIEPANRVRLWRRESAEEGPTAPIRIPSGTQR